jgi:hypothetical protein
VIDLLDVVPSVLLCNFLPRTIQQIISTMGLRLYTQIVTMQSTRAFRDGMWEILRQNSVSMQLCFPHSNILLICTQKLQIYVHSI